MWKSTSCDVTKSTMLSNSWRQRRLGAQDKPGLSSVYDTYVFLEHCSERRPSFFYSLPGPPARCCCGGPSIQSCSTKRCAPLHMYAVIYIGWAQREICSPASIFRASVQTTSAWGRRGSPAARRTCEKKKDRRPRRRKVSIRAMEDAQAHRSSRFLSVWVLCFSVWNFNVFLYVWRAYRTNLWRRVLWWATASQDHSGNILLTIFTLQLQLNQALLWPFPKVKSQNS